MIEAVEPWDYVCESVGNVYEKDVCENLEEPTVVVSEVLNINSWFGRLNGVYLPGEDYIFISPTSTNFARTLEHEMVHYVLHKGQVVPDSDKCEHERIARFVAGQSWTEREKGFYGCQAPSTTPK